MTSMPATRLREALLAVLLGLAACAPRAELSDLSLPLPGSPAAAERFEVLAVTTRARQSPRTNVFTSARSLAPNHALFHMAVAADSAHAAPHEDPRAQFNVLEGALSLE